MFSMIIFFSLFSRSVWICFCLLFLFANILFKKRALFQIVFFCFCFSLLFSCCVFRCREPVLKNMEISLLCFLVVQTSFLPISFLESFLQNNVPFVCFRHLGFWIPSYCFSFCLLLKKSWHNLFFLSLALLQSVFIFIICFCFFFSFVSFAQKKKEKYWNIFLFLF